MDLGREKQDSRHHGIEDADRDDGNCEIDDESEDGVELRVPGGPRGRVQLAQRDSVRRRDVRRHQLQHRQRSRHDPHDAGDRERLGRGRGAVALHRVHDGDVAVSAEHGQREDGHAERQRLQKLVQFAQRRSVRPLRERVDRRRKRDGDQNQEQVTKSQGHDEDVRCVPHVLVLEHSQDESSVAHDTDDEDQRKHHRDAKGFRSVGKY